jgi:hypothetical protein
MTDLRMQVTAVQPNLADLEALTKAARAVGAPDDARVKVTDGTGLSLGKAVISWTWKP